MAVTRLQVLTGKPRRPGGTCDGTCGGGHPAPIELPAVFPTDRNANGQNPIQTLTLALPSISASAAWLQPLLNNCRSARTAGDTFASSLHRAA